MIRTTRRAGVDDAAAVTSVHLASREDAYAPLAGAWPIADRAERTAKWVEILRNEGERPYFDTLAELRACSFYERHGGQVVERRPIDFHGATRTHVTYLWSKGGSSERRP